MCKPVKKHFKRNKNSWLRFAQLHIIANNFCPLKWAVGYIFRPSYSKDKHDRKSVKKIEILRDCNYRIIRSWTPVVGAFKWWNIEPSLYAPF